MRKKLVAGNWKMHGNLQSNAALLERLKSGVSSVGCEVAICAPFPYLAQVQSELVGTPISWGAQSLSEHESGAYTGEVSASMLVEFGCRYVLVGHSERRSLFGESDVTVAAKFVAAQKAGLVPVLCVGETLVERESGQTVTVVARQLDAVVGFAGVEALSAAVVAYEPVWAIGTGRTATPEQADEMCGYIRSIITECFDEDVAEKVVIQYGGSVKPGNAAELLNMYEIDGALVGGASLIPKDFLEIVNF